MDSVLSPLYFGYYAIAGFVSWYLKRFWVSQHPFKHQNICVINSIDECQAYTLQLVQNIRETRVVGFDCEWVGKNKVALLQLATVDGLCVLIRLSKLNHVPPEVKALLEDVTVLKVGVDPLNDAKNLRCGYGVNVRGCLDLRHLVVSPMKVGGLASLTKTVLGVELDKRFSVRCSNWEADKLKLTQIEYAARDALSAVKIFFKLAHCRLSYSFADRIKYSLINPRWDEIVIMCQKYLDKNFKLKPGRAVSASTGKSANKTHGTLSTPRYKTLKSPHYENCCILAPDGIQISTCSQRKVDWYVSKALGELVNNDPVSVQLFFEPSGRALDDKGLYNLQFKINQCVVCGVTEELIRKNVIPQEYKKYFPMLLVLHLSHDVLLLCTTCHQLSNFNDNSFKKTLEDMSFQNTAAPVVVVEKVIKKDVKKLKAAARALLTHRDKIPPNRCIELEKLIVDYYGTGTDLTETMLEEVLLLEMYVVNEGYQPHAYRIVEKFKAGPGLVCFQEMWRDYFIQTMRPRFLPPLWSITHNHIEIAAPDSPETLTTGNNSILSLNKL